jgi:hypothetical protein
MTNQKVRFQTRGAGELGPLGSKVESKDECDEQSSEESFEVDCGRHLRGEGEEQSVLRILVRYGEAAYIPKARVE